MKLTQASTSLTVLRVLLGISLLYKEENDFTV